LQTYDPVWMDLISVLLWVFQNLSV
jgi:hypothetical protein